MTDIEVRGRYLLADDRPAQGQVTFTPRVTAVNDATDGDILVNSPVRVTLDTSGEFAVTLQASDDSGLDPAGWTYRVVEEIAGTVVRIYDIDIPVSAAGGGIDLWDVAPATATAGDPTAFLTLTALGDALAQYMQLNPIVTGIARDSAGRVSSLIEGGIVESVTRDASGRIATVTTGTTTRTITRNSSGQIAGVA